MTNCACGECAVTNSVYFGSGIKILQGNGCPGLLKADKHGSNGRFYSVFENHVLWAGILYLRAGCPPAKESVYSQGLSRGSTSALFVDSTGIYHQKQPAGLSLPGGFRYRSRRSTEH